MMSPAYKANKLIEHYTVAVRNELKRVKLNAEWKRCITAEWFTATGSIVTRMVLDGSNEATKEFNAAYKAYRQYCLARGKGAQTYNAWVYSQQIKMVKELARQHVEEAFR